MNNKRIRSNPEKMLQAMSRFKIANQDTGEETSFSLYPEQIRFLNELCTGEDIIALKSRQVGFTTVCLAYCALHAVARPKLRVCVIAHVKERAERLAAILKNIAIQIPGVKVTKSNQSLVEFDNGSQIVIQTAGQENSGRGDTFHLIHCSEAGLYENSKQLMVNLTKSRFKNTQIIMESTASAMDTFFKAVWHKGPQWKHLFSSYEAHPNYRMDPTTIDDQTWENLRDEFHFTNRESAAYWYNDLVNNACGDFVAQLRECPITPEQAWLSFAGRFIVTDPDIKPYTTHPAHRLMRIFHPPDPKGRYAMSLDTATGKGQDDSALIVYDVLNKRIAAQFCDNSTDLPDLINLIEKIYLYYKPKLFVVEDNGIGETSVQFLRLKQIPVSVYSSTKDKRGWYWAKKQIEEYGLCSDERLVEHCKSTQVVTSKTGNVTFEGRKDLIAALSFLGAYDQTLKDIANAPEPRTVKKGAFDMYKIIKQEQKARGK